jgi:DNA-binding transcriptional LysR family regulator
VSESVAIGLKRAAVLLAEELDYERAAERLNMSTAELRRQISVLESQLYLHIFRPIRERVELTEEGQFLIKAFRKSVALHDRNASKDADETQ